MTESYKNLLPGRSPDHPFVGKDLAFAELWRSAIEVFDVLDEAGHPLGETNSVKGIAHLPYQFKKCPYHDHRLNHELPMNVTALQYVIDYWGQLSYLLEAMREAYKAQFQITEVNLGHALNIAEFGKYMIGYLLTRPEKPYRDGAIPFPPGALWKAYIGTKIALERRLLYDRTAKRDDPYDGKALYQMVDRMKLLVGVHGVCAGSPAMIEALFCLVKDGKAKATDAEKKLIHEMIDVHEATRYGRAHWQLDLIKERFYWTMVQTEERLRPLIDPAPAPGETVEGAAARARAFGAIVEWGERDKVRQIALSGNGPQDVHGLHGALLDQLDLVATSDTIRTLGRAVRPDPALVDAHRGEVDAALARLALVPEHRALASEVFRSYLGLERAALDAFTAAQAAINEVVKRPAPTRPASSADLQRAFGKPLGMRIAESLGLSMLHTPASLSFEPLPGQHAARG